MGHTDVTLNIKEPKTQLLEAARTIFFNDNYEAMRLLGKYGALNYRCYAGRNYGFSIKFNQGDHALLLTGLLHTDADADLNDDLVTLRREIDTALRTGDWSQPQATARRVDDDKIAACDRGVP